jgi:hypothetical protein
MTFSEILTEMVIVAAVVWGLVILTTDFFSKREKRALRDHLTADTEPRAIYRHAALDDAVANLQRDALATYCPECFMQRNAGIEQWRLTPVGQPFLCFEHFMETASVTAADEWQREAR